MIVVDYLKNQDKDSNSGYNHGTKNSIRKNL